MQTPDYPPHRRQAMNAKNAPLTVGPGRMDSRTSRVKGTSGRVRHRLGCAPDMVTIAPKDTQAPLYVDGFTGKTFRVVGALGEPVGEFSWLALAHRP